MRPTSTRTKQAGTRFNNPEWLSWAWCLVIKWNGLLVCRQSPIIVVTTWKRPDRTSNPWPLDRKFNVLTVRCVADAGVTSEGDWTAADGGHSTPEARLGARRREDAWRVPESSPVRRGVLLSTIFIDRHRHGRHQAARQHWRSRQQTDEDHVSRVPGRR